MNVNSIQFISWSGRIYIAITFRTEQLATNLASKPTDFGVSDLLSNLSVHNLRTNSLSSIKNFATGPFNSLHRKFSNCSNALEYQWCKRAKCRCNRSTKLLYNVQRIQVFQKVKQTFLSFPTYSSKRILKAFFINIDKFFDSSKQFFLSIITIKNTFLYRHALFSLGNYHRAIRGHLVLLRTIFSINCASILLLVFLSFFSSFLKFRFFLLGLSIIRCFFFFIRISRLNALTLRNNRNFIFRNLTTISMSRNSRWTSCYSCKGFSRRAFKNIYIFTGCNSLNSTSSFLSKTSIIDSATLTISIVIAMNLSI